MLKPVDDLLKTSFFGPWVPRPGQTQRVRHHYLSLAHWYESVKFMPIHPELRDAVLFCPSAKEARKYAKARQSEWRTDWNLIRHSVLIAGLGFLAIDRPDIKMESMSKTELTTYLKGLKLPERFIDGCLDRFALWAAGPSIGTFGANTAPDAIVGRKISKIVQAKPNWTLVSLCNNKTAWRLHDWALAHYVPVRYVGQISSRTSVSILDELVRTSDQMVVFEVKGGKQGDLVIQKAKSLKKSCLLELYAPEELTTASFIDRS